MTAFTSLPTDIFGAIIERAGLQKKIASMLGPHAGPADDLALAVGLSPAEKVREGNPADVGTRTSGSMTTRSGLSIRTNPDFTVSRASLTTSTGDLAAELATRLANDVRAMPSY